MQQLWSSASYQLHLLSLAFGFALEVGDLVVWYTEGVEVQDPAILPIGSAEAAP